MAVLALLGGVILRPVPSSAFIAYYAILIIAGVVVALVAQVEALRLMRSLLAHPDPAETARSASGVKVA